MNEPGPFDPPDLGDVLHRALRRIHSQGASLFPPEKLREAVDVLLVEAAAKRWIDEQIEETGIRAMDFRNGASMDLEPARELAAMWVGAARGLLQDAPNYSETKVSMDVKVAESPEMYTVVIQRHGPGRLTPHEARMRAEEQRDTLLKIIWEYCTEANEVGGIDAGDLAWRTTQAGFAAPED